jgi:phosphatidylserine/phosphatidylglycerophosphate/cardiolipin synthase-like enzyme
MAPGSQCSSAMKLVDTIRRVFVLTLVVLVFPLAAGGAELLCDPSTTDCRPQLLALIDNERQGIDVAFWFMEDNHYVNHLIARWQAGVPVRILMDPRANEGHPLNATNLTALKNAGIPMRYRTASGILHWKTMIFAGQEIVEFGSANYSDEAFKPGSAYTNYVSETIYYTSDGGVVDSFKRKFDDAWINTSSYANYANIKNTPVRHYPLYTIDPELNFPPSEDFGARSVSRYNAEGYWIDAIMFRITDARHTDALIAARQRGVGVRLIVDNGQYRDSHYLWDAYNVDRLYANGIQLRWRGHSGENHEKLVLLYGQQMTIFGSSNWTTASATSQAEHNYFTLRQYIFQWFANQFSRMWHNSAGYTETVNFTPLAPDTPAYKSPGNGGSASSTTPTLKWYGGPWAHYYDVYLGTSSTPSRIASNLHLGPSNTSSTYQTYTTPTLQHHTTYYWKIVSRTAAGKTKTGATWSFTTP